MDRYTHPLTYDMPAKQRWAWMTKLLGGWAMIGLRPALMRDGGDVGGLRVETKHGVTRPPT